MSPPAPERYHFFRRHRLTHRREFQAVYERRMRTGRGPLLIYACANGLGHPRLGLSISRRAGTAVQRNRMKRRLREAFRLHQHELPAADLVIAVRLPHQPPPPAEYGRLMLSGVAALEEKLRGLRCGAHPKRPET